MSYVTKTILNEMEIEIHYALNEQDKDSEFEWIEKTEIKGEKSDGVFDCYSFCHSKFISCNFTSHVREGFPYAVYIKPMFLKKLSMHPFDLKDRFRHCKTYISSSKPDYYYFFKTLDESQEFVEYLNKTVKGLY